MKRLDTHDYGNNKIDNLKLKIKERENFSKILQSIATATKQDTNDKLIKSVWNFIPKVNYKQLSEKYNDDLTKINSSIKDMYKRHYETLDYDIDIKAKLIKINDKTGVVKHSKGETNYLKAMSKPLPDYNEKPKKDKKKSKFTNYDSDGNEYESDDDEVENFGDSYHFSTVKGPKPAPKPKAAPKKKSAPKKVAPAPAASSGGGGIPTDETGLVNFARIVNKSSITREASVHVDSRYQNISNTNRSLLQFSLLTDTKVKQIGSGTITIIGNVEKVVSLTVPPFNIPYSDKADNYYKKVTLIILELISDCVETYENGKYHFIFSTVQVGNLLILTPDFPTYEFKKPVNLQEMTLSFGSPLVPITFDKDRLIVDTIDYANIEPGEITFLEPHYLGSASLIYFVNFVTTNPSENVELLSFLNRLEGHRATRTGDLTVTINFDFSTLLNPIANGAQIVEIYFGSKRIQFPLKIGYRVDNPLELY